MAGDLVESTVTQVLDLIVDGTYTVGQSMPGEAELAKSLNVSRPTLREAVKVLIGGGVLSVRHGRGTFVQDPANWTGVAMIAHAARGTVDPRLLDQQVLQVRSMIEIGAARLAATNRTDDDLEAMEQVLAAFAKADADGDVETAIDLDIRFHDLLTHSSGNPFVPAVLHPLSELLLAQRRRTTAIAEVRARAHRHHQRILEALTAGDADAAEAEMRAHMAQTSDDMPRA